MKKRIKVKFIDYGWWGFKPENEYIYKVLEKMYDIELSETPDYVIDGGFGHEHLKYDCIKILTNGENIVSDFNLFDYAFGHDYMTFGDRYIRLPHYATYPEFKRLAEPTQKTDEELLNRKFCSFVVSNFLGDTFRDDFFRELSKYKTVASGGRHLNNIGGPVKDKLEFCKDFKFNIAFENSISPGYTTEKVMQPLSVDSLPIYWGDPLIGNDFNPEGLIIVKDRADMQRAIEEIIYLDTHDEAYLRKVRATHLIRPVESYEEALATFLKNIFEQPLESARRLNRHGFQSLKRKDLITLYHHDDIIMWPRRTYRKIRAAFRKIFHIKAPHEL